MFKEGQNVRMKDSVTAEMIERAILLERHRNAMGVVAHRINGQKDDRVRVWFRCDELHTWFVPYDFLELVPRPCMFQKEAQ